MRTYRSSSSGETKRLGAELARRILRARRNSRSAVILGLVGDLGSGKTTFVKGFARGIDIPPRRIVSPTFIMVRRIGLKKSKNFANLYHIDAYRIERGRELRALGLREILRDPQNIVLIEWADRIRKALPRGATRIRFAHGRKENERVIMIKN